MPASRNHRSKAVPFLLAIALLSCGQYDAPGGEPTALPSRLASAANLAVQWTVQEAPGGSISSGGLYTAGQATGTYHVVATSLADPTKTSTATVTVTATPPAAARQVGLNLGWVNGAQPDQIFANVAKQARAWTLAGGDTLAAIGFDGWPAGSDLRLGFSEGAGQPRTSGYKLRFRGTVTSYSGSNGCTVSGSTFDGTFTTADVTVTDGNAWIEFRGARRSDGTPGITDVSLMRPGHTLTADHFNKQFVSALSGITAIRAMQAGGPGLDNYGVTGAVGVMGNRDTTWSSRQKPRVSYAYNGPAWEEWVLLANLLDKDIWINIPFHVDADYVRKLGYLLRYGSDGATGEPYTTQAHDPATWTVGTTAWYPGLEPGRKIWVEYGNELWNVGYGYPNSSEVQTLYNNEIAAGDIHHLNWDGNGGTDRWVAWKTVWISNLLRQAWGSAMQTTIRMVLPTQGGWGNWDRANAALQYITYTWGASSPWNTIDGMTNPKQSVNYYVETVAGSFYVNWSGRVTVTNADTAFQSMNGGLSGPTSDYNTTKQRIDYGATRTAQYGLTFSCYEGGTEVPTGLPGDWQSWWYTDARMKTLLKEEMNYFFAKSNAEVYFHFMMMGNGSFGLSADYSNLNTQRWQAVKEVAAGR